ncbi:hypothetical protein BB561_001726 [Smittium simulii]|uniref:Glutaredoxin domain-containing protein n=1 Tax=Smittium simulii TaxID=133385 RepID=A0A2T9YTA7_9FUNG|nr:hypothetical protein BB561_001726 [Smittium simulii]
MPVKKLLLDLIQKNSTMVFSKSYCPFCNTAKKALSQHKYDFKALELDLEPNGDKIQAQLQALTGQTTVPNIFINQKHIGGCDALLKKLSLENV